MTDNIQVLNATDEADINRDTMDPEYELDDPEEVCILKTRKKYNYRPYWQSARP
jgi:hypothetical protein